MLNHSTTYYVAIARIAVRHRFTIVRIHLKFRMKYIRLYIAGRLVKIAYRLSPDFFKEYDRVTIKNWYERNEI